MKSILTTDGERNALCVHYQTLLEIEEPLYIKEVITNKKLREIRIHVDFRRGTKFACPTCGAQNCTVSKTTDKSWKTLKIHGNDCYIHFRTPYIKCTCGTSIYRPHWENGSSKFTVWFENEVIFLAHAMMPVSWIGAYFGEHDTLIRRIINRYVDAEYAQIDWSNVKCLAVDEIYLGKKHKYVSVFTDNDTGRVLFIADGKRQGTFRQFVDEARKHGLTPKKITDISMDMSGAFIAGATKYFPKAEITFDKFHIVKLLNQAMNDVRKAENEHKDCRYEVLKKSENLNLKQKKKLKEVLALNDKIARAYAFKESFSDILSYDLSAEQAELLIDQWVLEVRESDIVPMKKFANTVYKYWYGVIRYFTSRITNAISEGINSVIRSYQGVARGFGNRTHFKKYVYLKKGL